ncbi:alcohol dehydrogenase catalytic domain-containing protein [Amycolatopsis sp. DSM 110486]|uniref:alcohol dehydrogenase catalytic domain-containing protein n=1 Tax=Amycolatopsis sp. DSM 110486 TaxID=2865832 RepID=UPI001C6A2843|nr:alcohol dehydrogenase catalytic domain-containing protein [Amycolatopsis sp. DSM 110486]QYN21342.1 alcohol dehydrogenase catalytic domain-containing protein [Amycolatopsis sp. DSM 110486]
MRAAGIDRFGGDIRALDFDAPASPGPDEVVVAVRAAGVGNWDDIARTGGWDLGTQPPMALGVEAAGVVAEVGGAVRDFAVGDGVAVHSAPLRAQGAWAERFLAGAAEVAALPDEVDFATAAAFAVPALTADQALRDAVELEDGQTLLVHGAGGVTGRLLVALGANYGARVIATGSPSGAEALTAARAAQVLSYSDPSWPETARELGIDCAVNAVPGQAALALTAVRDGGHLATITSDPPAPARGISPTEVYVAPDGPRLATLLRLLAAGTLPLDVGARFSLSDAAEALAQVRRGTHGSAVVLTFE